MAGGLLLEKRAPLHDPQDRTGEYLWPKPLAEPKGPAVCPFGQSPCWPYRHYLRSCTS